MARNLLPNCGLWQAPSPGVGDGGRPSLRTVWNIMGERPKPAGQPVMVVDDDRDIRTFVTLALEEEGFPVAGAEDGLEALNRVTDVRPFLIILDVEMPRMNGYEFLAAYHGLPPPHAPIVLFSAHPEVRERAKSVQVDGVIVKPFDLDELLGVVQEHAGRLRA